MVRLDGTKMSKSLGNLVFVRDLLKEWEPAAIRLAVIAHHYRGEWDWTDELMPDAAARLAAWRAAGGATAPWTRCGPRSTTTWTRRRPCRHRRGRGRGEGVSEAAALLGVA